MNIRYGVKTYDYGFRPLLLEDNLEYVSIHVFATWAEANDFAFDAYVELHKGLHAAMTGMRFIWQESLEK